MIILFIIGLVTIYVSLLNFKRFDRVSMGLKRFIIFFMVILYALGLIMFLKNLDPKDFKDNAFYVLIIAALFIAIDGIVRYRKKQDQNNQQ